MSIIDRINGYIKPVITRWLREALNVPPVRRVRKIVEDLSGDFFSIDHIEARNLAQSIVDNVVERAKGSELKLKDADKVYLISLLQSLILRYSCFIFIAQQSEARDTIFIKVIDELLIRNRTQLKNLSEEKNRHLLEKSLTIKLLQIAVTYANLASFKFIENNQSVRFRLTLNMPSILSKLEEIRAFFNSFSDEEKDERGVFSNLIESIRKYLLAFSILLLDKDLEDLSDTHNKLEESLRGYKLIFERLYEWRMLVTEFNLGNMDRGEAALASASHHAQENDTIEYKLVYLIEWLLREIIKEKLRTLSALCVDGDSGGPSNPPRTGRSDDPPPPPPSNIQKIISELCMEVFKAKIDTLGDLRIYFFDESCYSAIFVSALYKQYPDLFDQKIIIFDTSACKAQIDLLKEKLAQAEYSAISTEENLDDMLEQEDDCQVILDRRQEQVRNPSNSIGSSGLISMGLFAVGVGAGVLAFFCPSAAPVLNEVAKESVKKAVGI